MRYLIVLFIAVFVHGTTLAQNTPTPDPNKTNTPNTNEESTPSAPPSAFEPYTQSDLRILTGNVQRPNGIVWFNDSLYTACTGDMTVYEIDAETGLTTTLIGGVNNAHTLFAEEREENVISLWVPDFTSNQLLNVEWGSIDRVAEDLQGPWGIAYLDEENFLITNMLGNNLMRINRDGEGEVTLDGLTSPTGLVIDDEYVYIANNGSTRRAIEWYALDSVDGGETETSQSDQTVLVSGLQNTTGLAMGSDGYLYFAYSLGTRGVVGRIDPDYCRENGGCTNEDIQIVIYTELEAPLAGLTISPDMRLYIHTMFRPEIYSIQIDG